MHHDQDSLWIGPNAVLRAGRRADDANDAQAAMQSAKAGGWDGVEWPVHTDFSSAVTMLDRIAASSAKQTSLRCTVAFSLHTTDLERAIHETAEVLNRCAAIGATCLNLKVPSLRCVPSDEPREAEGAVFTRYQDQLNFAFQLSHRARFSAERAGVPLALEAACGCGLLSPVELRELIDEANSAAVGVCLDVERIARVGAAVDWLKTLRHRVHAVRMTGGDVDRPLLDALARSGFDRTLILEDPAHLPAARSLFDPRD